MSKAKPKRLTIDIPAELQKRLDAVAVRVGVTTYSSLVRRAVSLLVFLAENSQIDGEIVFEVNGKQYILLMS